MKLSMLLRMSSQLCHKKDYYPLPQLPISRFWSASGNFLRVFLFESRSKRGSVRALGQRAVHPPYRRRTALPYSRLCDTAVATQRTSSKAGSYPLGVLFPGLPRSSRLSSSSAKQDLNSLDRCGNSSASQMHT
jgi:hypothetical protein